jgi:hypothetical protein
VTGPAGAYPRGVVDGAHDPPGPPAPVPDAGTIAGLLADDDRRRVVAALVLGASTLGEVRAATGLGTRAAAGALARLVAGDLVVRADDGHHVLLAEAFRRAAIAAAPARPPPRLAGDAPEDEARVLRSYFRGDRLTRLPAQRAKKRVVLERLAQEFEVGVRYPEREVNAILRRFHPDVAALRRSLVEEELLAREAGVYWRTGGRVAL